jgi:hypothetical protein
MESSDCIMPSEGNDPASERHGSILEASVQCACTIGLKHSASLAEDGRRIRIGTRTDYRSRRMQEG